MSYPNNDYWKALADGAEIELFGKPYVLRVIDCGDLVLPTGLLAICDPFSMMEVTGNTAVQVPPGRYPVKVTLADVSGLRDGSHFREAYASLILGDAPEVLRRPLLFEGTDFNAFGVDAGTACFVDEGALAAGMPPREDSEDWEDVFDDGTEASWFSRMDDPAHIRAGLANIVLPRAQNGENIILIHSGWGDGVYGVLGGYDRTDTLVAVHIDFHVVGEPVED